MGVPLPAKGLTMFPELLNLGFIQLKTYGACMAIGFLLCWTLIERLSGRKDISNLLMSLMVSGVIGSRIAYVIEHWNSEFEEHPLAVIRVDQGGLMFYGGLILAIAVFFAWCFVKKEQPLALADLLCTAVPLGHACGRIGCFFYGCCFGRCSSSALAVAFPRHSPAWYTQLHGGQITASAEKALPVFIRRSSSSVQTYSGRSLKSDSAVSSSLSAEPSAAISCICSRVYAFSTLKAPQAVLLR